MTDTMISRRPGDESSTDRVAIVTGGAKQHRACDRPLNLLAAGGGGGDGERDGPRSTTQARDRARSSRSDDGGRAAHFLADVSDPEAVQAMVDATVEQFGSALTTVVNNHTHRLRHASTSPSSPSRSGRRSSQVVLTRGLPHLQGRGVPHMIAAGGGSIVNISGQMAHIGYRGGGHLLRGEGGCRRNVQGRCPRPRRASDHCQLRRPRGDRHRAATTAPATSAVVAVSRALPPVGRIGIPEEIASMVRMLCGPDSRFVTGQIIHAQRWDFRPLTGWDSPAPDRGHRSRCRRSAVMPSRWSVAARTAGSATVPSPPTIAAVTAISAHASSTTEAWA